MFTLHNRIHFFNFLYNTTWFIIKMNIALNINNMQSVLPQIENNDQQNVHRRRDLK